MATSGKAADRSSGAARHAAVKVEEVASEVQTNVTSDVSSVTAPTTTTDPVAGYTTHEPVPGSEGPRSQLELDQQVGR